MKRRQGYVSNSSSSSFIIGITSVPPGEPCDFVLTEEVAKGFDRGIRFEKKR